jgi:hypothetical protein
MNDYKNNYNVRDSKGRFSKVVPAGVTANAVSKKEVYLQTLREKDVFVTFNKDGQNLVRVLSLQPTYLTGYVGKGTSKKTDDNVIFAYDVDEERFRRIELDKVVSFIPI